MNIITHHEDNALVIKLPPGIIDSDMINQINPHTLQAIEQGKSVVFNCDQVEGIDTSGITWLQEFHQRMYDQHQLSMVLCHTNAIKSNLDSLEYIQQTPTLIEALDIVNMEVIERELLQDFDDENED